MRRSPQIRITKDDRKEYSRLAKNSKAKIRRTHENYGIDLSPEIRIPDISEFSSRKEFNDWKEQQRSFTNRANTNYQFVKNEYGVVASKRELLEIERNTKIAQRIAKNKIKEVEKNPAVEQRMGQMAKPENLTGISMPKDFDYDKIRSRDQLEKKMKNIEERTNEEYFDKRMEQLKLNFIKALDDNYNSDAEELVKKIKGIPAEDLFEIYLYLTTEGNMDIDYIYTTEASGQENNDVVSKISSYIDRYVSGEMNMDMKGF